MNLSHCLSNLVSTNVGADQIVPSNENERSHILNQLNLMNINSSTLFPDLSGSAKHCNYLLNKKVKDD